MLRYVRQNKNIIIVAITLFMVSMSTLMFFLGSNKELHNNELKTNNIHESKSDNSQKENHHEESPSKAKEPDSKKIKNSTNQAESRLMAEKTN